MMIEVDPYDDDTIAALMAEANAIDSISVDPGIVEDAARVGGPGQWVVGPCECINCGFRAVVVIPAEPPQYNADENWIDMVECTRCGKYTLCSE
jgi:hypothetical protein